MNSKTLIFSPSFGIWGGGQIYIEQLCNFLIKNNCEAYILTAEPEKFNTKTLKIPRVLSKKDRLLHSISIAKEYKNKGFKNIILNDLSSLWLAPIFKVYGFNVISLLHLYLQRRSENPLGHSLLEYYLLKGSSYFCDYIFSVNKENQKVFGKKVVFIGNYVPEWFFEKQKIYNKKYDFLIISRLSKQKNIPLFLNFFEKLIKNYNKNYKALIVGEGPERKNIINIIKKKHLEEYITIEGWENREKLPNKYDLGKVFVISSYHEGFATTLLESHARGLPAIVTKTSGFCGEFVESFGEKTGIVFDVEDLQNENFYKKIINLVENHYEYEKKCIKKAKIFSEENVLKPILEVLK